MRRGAKSRDRGSQNWGRAKSSLVLGATLVQFPIRVKLLRPEDRLMAYPWTSVVWYAAAPEHRPQWIRANPLPGEHDIQLDNARQTAIRAAMEAPRLFETDEEALKVFRRGWPRE